MKNIFKIVFTLALMAMGSTVMGAAVYAASGDVLSAQLVSAGMFTLSSLAQFIPTETGLAFSTYTPVKGSGLRAVFDGIRASYMKKGGSIPVITYSYLRSEVVLGQTSTVRFPILTQDSPQANANERRLNVSDAFQVTQLGIFIYKQPSGANISSGILNTFPNPLLYTGSGEAAALQAIYNGFLNITIDRKEIIPAIDCMNFYNVGTAQSAVLTAASGTGNSYQASAFESGYGFHDVTPTFKYSGSLVNEVTLNLPESVNMAGTSSTNRIVLISRGFLIQGGANFTSDNP